MAIARVQSKAELWSGETTVVTLDDAPLDGSLLVLVAMMESFSGEEIESIAQTGATWARAAELDSTVPGAGRRVEIWYAEGVTGAGAGLTVTLTSAGTAAVYVVAEYSGVATSGALDKIATHEDSLPEDAPKVTGTTATTSEGAELWAGVIGQPGAALFFLEENGGEIAAQIDGGLVSCALIDRVATPASPDTAWLGCYTSLSDHAYGAIATFRAYAAPVVVAPAEEPAGWLLDDGGPLEVDILDPGRDRLRELVIVALFSDRRAEAGDPIPDGTSDRRGWWGDAYVRDGRRLGSRLWLLSRATVTPATIEAARGYIEEALAPLIADGHVSRVEVEVERAGRHQVDATIRLVRAVSSLPPLELRYRDLFGSSLP